MRCQSSSVRKGMNGWNRRRDASTHVNNMRRVCKAYRAADEAEACNSDDSENDAEEDAEGDAAAVASGSGSLSACLANSM